MNLGWNSCSSEGLLCVNPALTAAELGEGTILILSFPCRLALLNPIPGLEQILNVYTRNSGEWLRKEQIVNQELSPEERAPGQGLPVPAGMNLPESPNQRDQVHKTV